MPLPCNSSYTLIAILIIHWQEMLLINHHWILFPLFLLFCNTVDECMEFIVCIYYFRNITLYKANYNTNTFWPRGVVLLNHWPNMRIWQTDAVVEDVDINNSSKYSRLLLFRLSEVRPPRYTGHLAWHGMLAICLLHKTHPEVIYTATRYSVYRPVPVPKTRNFTRVLRPDMTFWVWFPEIRPPRYSG